MKTTASRINEEELRKAVQKRLEQPGMSQSRISRETGINKARLSQWLSGKYAGDTESVALEVERWLRREEMESDAAQGDPSGWQPTPTGNSVMSALRYAQNFGDIALIYGGAGVGKTCSARQYQQEFPNVWIATMTPAVLSVSACLERLIWAVGMAECPTSTIKAENALVKRLEGSKGLLVVDEAQHLSVTCLEAVRSIHDATGTGLALMGNETVYARITGGSRKANFAQLFSRIGFRISFSSPSRGDVDTILDAWNIRETKARTLCAEIAGRAGALRSLAKVLRMAGVMKTEQEENIGYDAIYTAWQELGGVI